MIERTKDYRRIKGLAPKWDLVVSDEVYYLVEMENGEDIGAIVFHPTDEPGMLMHVALGPECRGARAGEAYRNAFEWMFTNTDCEKLLGRIPETYQHARVMAQNIGGEFTGIDNDNLRCYSIEKKSYQKAAISDE